MGEVDQSHNMEYQRLFTCMFPNLLSLHLNIHILTMVDSAYSVTHVLPKVSRVEKYRMQKSEIMNEVLEKVEIYLRMLCQNQLVKG